MDIENYYLEQLKEQASFLTDACENYDKGKFAQAKMLSAIIRTLVKDPDNPRRNNRTKSLLNLLDRKNEMKFYNTGFEAKNAVSNVNLIGLATVPSKTPTVTKQFDHIYLPLLDTSSQIDIKWLNFEQWWNSQILVFSDEGNNIIFTRKRIVLTMAEQDGGAHIDSHHDIDKEYLELATAAKSYFYGVDSSGNESPIINMHYALVRQIAHELLISLIKEFKLNIAYRPTNEFNLRGVHKKHIKQPSMMVKGAKIESTRTSTPRKAPVSQTVTTPPNARYVRVMF
ncbi:hypothetical protein [Bacillus thuringiensis]|uniref:hypothetical protein n=1 Tax=Bacillus thuringiensis TaxID=1428 RepID=UPI000BFE102B|nr:hypothetical protein [Bacillus thuringiensis]PGM02690.1 hypothetical protein CN938_30780 [Bacillus thuringiensis]